MTSMTPREFLLRQQTTPLGSVVLEALMSSARETLVKTGLGTPSARRPRLQRDADLLCRWLLQQYCKRRKAFCSSTGQKLHRATSDMAASHRQKRLAKTTALASRQKRQHHNIQELSTREKLIFDQCLMKANAKSPTAVR